jgi:hypothetical protein
MNAVTQAGSFELASKIAHLAVLFRAEFPNAEVDLRPWLTDPETQCQLDPRSIDISFHFPMSHSGLGCRCVLVLVYFSDDLAMPGCTLSRIEAGGFDQGEKQWEFSSETNQFAGPCQPVSDYQDRFRYLVKRLKCLFRSLNQPTSEPEFWV